MARFNPGPLGEINGKIGNYVFRKVNGKYFVSIRPDHYKMSESTEAKNSRDSFANCVRLAKLVTQFPDLRLVWKSAPIKGSSEYHRILKQNLPFTREGRLSVLNIITPEGFTNPVENVRLAPDSLLIKINNRYTFDENNSSVYKLFYVIYSYNQSDADKSVHDFISGTSEISVVHQTELHINLSSKEQQIIRQYHDFIVYITLLSYSDSGKITWSSSYASKQHVSDLSG